MTAAAVLLAAHDLAVGHRGSLLLRAVTLSVQAGQCWFMLGPNGAGKSTLLAVLAGTKAALSGRVEVDGRALGDWRRGALARRLALLPQAEDGLFEGSVEAFVALGRFPWRGRFGLPAPDDAAIIASELAAFELGALAGRPFEQLSGGERQRARLAQLFVQRAPLLLLDEPFTHLDLRHQVALVARLRQHCALGAGAVFAVVHEFGWTVQTADRLAFAYPDGHVETGPAHTLLDASRLGALLGCQFMQATIDGRQIWLPQT